MGSIHQKLLELSIHEYESQQLHYFRLLSQIDDWRDNYTDILRGSNYQEAHWEKIRD